MAEERAPPAATTGSTGFTPSVAKTGAGAPETVREILEALSETQFPVARRDLALSLAGRTARYRDGSVPLDTLVERLPLDRIDNAAQVKEAIARNRTLLDDLVFKRA